VTKDTNAIVQSQFGAAAADYATSEVHAKGESLARIVDLAAPQKSWHVLDVATGAGHMAAAFAPHVASVVASDITAEMLTEASKLAASRNLLNMTTQTAEAGSLPFPDETFDLVCCRLAAHHFPSLDSFVDEVHRVLKKQGRFALVDNVAPDRELLPDASDQDLEDVLVTYNAFEKLRDPSHGFAPPPEVWVDLLEDRSFSIAAREQFGKEIAFAPWVTRMRCAPDVVAKLESILSEGPPPLRNFLAPRRDKAGALHFTLQELLLVADKAA
jgi:ubiquinone/menaquinone biosynthesis C-methylase UbiE